MNQHPQHVSDRAGSHGQRPCMPPQFSSAGLVASTAGRDARGHRRLVGTMIDIERFVWAFLVGAVIVVSGCGPVTERVAASSAPTSEPAMSEIAYSCRGPAYAESMWAAQRPANEIAHPGRDALLNAVDQDDLRGWFLLEASERRLAVARERDAQQEPEGQGPNSHDFVSVVRYGADNWRPGQSSSCTPTRVLDGMGSADVWLNGTSDLTSRQVKLLVNEKACASGQDARGRIQTVAVEEDVETVELVLAVTPRRGEQTCQANPPTAMTIELEQPLGDRTVIDTSVWPPRPLTPYPYGPSPTSNQ
jgi:hypothetical protein